MTSLFWILRIILFIPQPRFTKHEAIEIARRECDRLGWEWRDPHAVERLRHWVIWTMYSIRPSPYIVVHQQTGDVVKSARLLR